MNRLAKAAGATAIAAALGAIAERTMLAAPHYRGPESDHFDGTRFHNLEPTIHESGGLIRWMLNRERGPWRDWVAEAPGPKPPERVADGKVRITFVNHATMLVQMDGLNILTDPMWSERCSPFRFAGPKRHRNPGIRLEDLPPIDAILVSHNHYDHLDLPTLRTLQAKHQPRIVTPLGNDLLMARGGVDGAKALEWWDTQVLSDTVKVTVVPAQHFCARALSDRDRTLWGGFVISGPSGNVYFAGDTGWGSHFGKIREHFGSIRVALLPIGAYLPRWFMRPVHISPYEMVSAHQALGATVSIPMHYGTFHLGDDGEMQPLDDLRKTMAERKVTNVTILGFGEGREF
jgi:L-ascorbate metabolism protein UlaG (beta-lactamase superfamily)